MNTRNKETQIQKKGLGVFINTCIKYLFPNILFLHYVSQISKQRQFSQYKKNMYIYTISQYNKSFGTKLHDISRQRKQRRETGKTGKKW